MKLPTHLALAWTGVFIALALCACSNSGHTPNSSMKAVCAAIKNRDVRAYKKMLSKGKLAAYEDQARRSNIPVDDLLKGYIDIAVCPEPLVEGRDHINGNTATLELKNASTNETDTYRFLKEDGEWKLN